MADEIVTDAKLSPEAKNPTAPARQKKDKGPLEFMDNEMDPEITGAAHHEGYDLFQRMLSIVSRANQKR